MVVEALDQLKLEGKSYLCISQAGVGAMAGGILGYLVAISRKHPSTIIMEPKQHVYKIIYSDGKPHNVLGELDTIMAGLSCESLIKLPGKY